MEIEEVKQKVAEPEKYGEEYLTEDDMDANQKLFDFRKTFFSPQNTSMNYLKFLKSLFPTKIWRSCFDWEQHNVL